LPTRRSTRQAASGTGERRLFRAKSSVVAGHLAPVRLRYGLTGREVAPLYDHICLVNNQASFTDGRRLAASRSSLGAVLRRRNP
jgi:hypothetical protein